MVASELRRASNPATGSKELDTLSRSADPKVRLAVAWHAKTSDRTLVRLFRKDEDFDVQFAAVRRLSRKGVELFGSR